jgi:extracellular factor (EF) 3-hydroxypalmitic acid methyl ester biosynthesis protein
MTLCLKTTNDVVDLIKHEIREFVRDLPGIAQGDPKLFAEHLQRKLDYLNAMSRCCPNDRTDLMQYCVQMCAQELCQSLIQRQSIDKPLGYAGDFQVIDWIYDYKADSPGRGRLWDEFFHELAAPQAVRNRKDYFCNLFTATCKQTPAPRSVLDIACGPCREVIDAVAQAGPLARGTLFHCVDIEKRAIAYAQEKTRKVKGVSFQWETANVLRIRPACQYDLVWCAGLFDYLNDRLATLLLKRMWRWTKEGGSCVIGNFHANNPSRNYMEWCGGWCLIHRTDDDIKQLCSNAHIPMNCVEISHEPLRTIVFAVASK